MGSVACRIVGWLFVHRILAPFLLDHNLWLFWRLCLPPLAMLPSETQGVEQRDSKRSSVPIRQCQTCAMRKTCWRMLKWFVGSGPRPTFERWAYWEKFDFFGASSDIILIGTTGLILWFPNWFCTFLPGEAVNVAKVVHSTLALLATGFVFAIHFFGTHFRADKFPMDMSILTGVVSETEMEHERPELLARLEAEGRLDELRATAPPRGKLCSIRIAGFIALALGLAALAGIIWSLLV